MVIDFVSFSMISSFKKHCTTKLPLLFCMWTCPHFQLCISYLCEVNWSKVKVAQSCLTLCDLMDCSLPGSSVHGILQARIPKWLAVPFYRGSSQPRYRIQVSNIAGGFFTIWATREASSSHQVAKVLEFQLQPQSFQWIFRTDFL